MRSRTSSSAPTRACGRRSRARAPSLALPGRPQPVRGRAAPPSPPIARMIEPCADDQDPIREAEQRDSLRRLIARRPAAPRSTALGAADARARRHALRGHRRRARRSVPAVKSLLVRARRRPRAGGRGARHGLRRDPRGVDASPTTAACGPADGAPAYARLRRLPRVPPRSRGVSRQVRGDVADARPARRARATCSASAAARAAPRRAARPPPARAAPRAPERRPPVVGAMLAGSATPRRDAARRSCRDRRRGGRAPADVSVPATHHHHHRRGRSRRPYPHLTRRPPPRSGRGQRRPAEAPRPPCRPGRAPSVRQSAPTAPAVARDQTP